MYTERILSEVKNALSDKARDIQADKIEEYFEWVKPHHQILKSLQEIHEMQNAQEPEIELDSPDDEPQTDELLPKSTKPDVVNLFEEDEKLSRLEDSYPEPYPIGRVFPFRLRAFGGTIDELNYSIAEEFIREKGLRNGNLVKVVEKAGFFPSGDPRYLIALEDSSVEEENEQLGEIESGIVEEKGGRLFVQRTVNGRIKDKDENPVVLYIGDRDIARFKLKEGDVINGRFYHNNITATFRATYRHPIETVQAVPSIEERRLAYRSDTDDEDAEKGLKALDRVDTTDLTDQKILLVGLAHAVTQFENALSEVGHFQFTHLTGDEHKMRIRSQIIKATIVLISTVQNSHDTSKYVADVCNTHDIPFTSTHGTGITSILNDAKDLIGK